MPELLLVGLSLVSEMQPQLSVNPSRPFCQLSLEFLNPDQLCSA
jgi:hypothetical protein